MRQVVQVVHYLHEGRLRSIEHAGPVSCVLVCERHHVEAHSLWNSQDDRQHPDDHDFDSSQKWDPHALNPTPGRYSPVPVVTKTDNKQIQCRDQ